MKQFLLDLSPITGIMISACIFFAIYMMYKAVTDSVWYIKSYLEDRDKRLESLGKPVKYYDFPIIPSSIPKYNESFDFTKTDEYSKFLCRQTALRAEEVREKLKIAREKLKVSVDYLSDSAAYKTVFNFPLKYQEQNRFELVEECYHQIAALKAFKDHVKDPTNAVALELGFTDPVWLCNNKAVVKLINAEIKECKRCTKGLPNKYE